MVDPFLHQNDCHGIPIRREEGERDKRRQVKDAWEREMERMVDGH